VAAPFRTGTITLTRGVETASIQNREPECNATKGDSQFGINAAFAPAQ
jgi:hypothetical protein